MGHTVELLINHTGVNWGGSGIWLGCLFLLLGANPGADQGLSGGIIWPLWLRNTLVSPRRSSRDTGVKDVLFFSSWTCFLHDPTRDKWKRMDEWIDGISQSQVSPALKCKQLFQFYSDLKDSLIFSPRRSCSASTCKFTVHVYFNAPCVVVISRVF